MEQMTLSAETFDAAVRKMVEVTQTGGLILFPTDTVYGLGGRAFSRQVLEKLQRVKPERGVKPTAVLIDNIIRMSQCAGDVPHKRIVALAEAFWPGALTMVWKTSNVIPEEFQTQDRSLGYRVPKSKFLLEVLKLLEIPLWATSANLPAQPAPRLFSEVKPQIIQACDLVIESRELMAGRSSSIVDIRGRDPIVLREGAVKEEDIRRTWRSA